MDPYVEVAQAKKRLALASSSSARKMMGRRKAVPINRGSSWEKWLEART